MNNASICLSWNARDRENHGDAAVYNQRAMNDFLRGIERRALKMAELSVGNRDDALEVVQDTMLGLVRRYRQRPESEWKPLFYRILQSRINDFHRRRAVRQRIVSLVAGQGDETAPDPIEQASAGERAGPAESLQREIANQAMLDAIAALPTRQQQAFMLRAWEGMPVADTAIAMRCSEGSVKTHYSRALSALQHALAEFSDSEKTHHE
ncbi:MAG: RNA polymerase sigma factor [Halieaceae bacterium]|nr:RNA polymerase sigma factor [Halieaceae bacterium]